MLFNNVTLIGNLGADIQLKQTSAGQTYGYVNIAQTRTYESRAGETVQETSWFRLKAWGKVAERMQRETAKGSRLLVEGKLASRTYEKDGQTREIVEVVVQGFQRLERPAAKPAEAAAAAEVVLN